MPATPKSTFVSLKELKDFAFETINPMALCDPHGIQGMVLLLASLWAEEAYNSTSATMVRNFLLGFFLHHSPLPY